MIKDVARLHRTNINYVAARSGKRRDMVQAINAVVLFLRRAQQDNAARELEDLLYTNSTQRVLIRATLDRLNAMINA